MMVEPAAMKLMATPETIWLPRWVIEAKPWTSAKKTEIRIAAREPDPGRAGNRGGRSAGEGAGQHLALEPDVEDAGALGIKAGEAGKQQRHRQADGRVEHVDDDVEEIHLRRPSLSAPATPAERGLSVASSVWMVGRNMCSSAPANRMTSPWMMTIMSREISGISKASSAPPW